MGMHHSENNMHDDLSTTLKYRRDNPIHFARYFGRFFFAGIFELSRYFAKRKRWEYMFKTLLGELSWYVVVVALLVLNPWATFTVFIFPFVFTRMGMMAGNWGQHAFVDPEDPENNYRNSITCINSRYNRRCFNDGYHIGHHLRANRHWTDLPVEFQQNLAKYDKERAIVFEGIDFFIVWWLLMTKNFKKLARHMVDLGESRRSEDEKIALMKSRLSPLARAQVTPIDRGAPFDAVADGEAADIVKA